MAAFPSLTAPAALIAAIFSDVYSGPVNAALMVVFLAGREPHLFADFLDAVLLAGAAKAIIGTSVLAVLLFQLLWVIQGIIETQHWNGPGKVLLFPSQISHSRKFPRTHSFSYSYLTVGIPVGFEGNAGGMVSVGAKGQHGLFSWPFGSRRGWFTIDAGDYLDRGKVRLGLQEKLADYLSAHGVDPAAYPYAYLVTAARFLGYQFNPVSFWYLYDGDKRLAAMILEVNNTFDERRIYLLTPDKDRTGQGDHLPGTEANQAERVDYSSRHNPRQVVFKESWPKDFHVSPFNSRKGSYRLTTTDPLHPAMQGTGPISATIALMSSKEHLKLVASLSSAGAAIDPCSMTTSEKIYFLSSWWWVGLLTFPRILKEAVRLFIRRRLHVWLRPEPRKGTIGRRPTATEQLLEPIFRRYLQHVVESSTSRLSVTYHPAAGLGGQRPQIFLSRAAQPHPEHGRATPAHHIDFHVLTPVFYTRFLRYSHSNVGALVAESDGDEHGTLAISPWQELLPRLLALGPPQTTTAANRELLSGGPGVDLFRVIQCIRIGPGLKGAKWGVTSPSAGVGVDQGREMGETNVTGMSGMDDYVLVHEAAGERTVYERAVLREFLAERIAFGSGLVLGGMQFLLRLGLAWFLSGVVSSVLKLVKA